MLRKKHVSINPKYIRWVKYENYSHNQPNQQNAKREIDVSREHAGEYPWSNSQIHTSMYTNMSLVVGEGVNVEQLSASLLGNVQHARVDREQRHVVHLQQRNYSLLRRRAAACASLVALLVESPLHRVICLERSLSSDDCATALSTGNNMCVCVCMSIHARQSERS